MKKRNRPRNTSLCAAGMWRAGLGKVVVAVAALLSCGKHISVHLLVSLSYPLWPRLFPDKPPAL